MPHLQLILLQLPSLIQRVVRLGQLRSFVLRHFRWNAIDRPLDHEESCWGSRTLETLGGHHGVYCSFWLDPGYPYRVLHTCVTVWSCQSPNNGKNIRTLSVWLTVERYHLGMLYLGLEQTNRMRPFLARTVGDDSYSSK